MREEVNDVFLQSVASSMDKDATIIEMTKRCHVCLTEAIRDYNRLARAAGIALGTKERTKKIYEQLSRYDKQELIDNTVRKIVASDIATQFEISLSSSMQTLRSFCSLNGIELPTTKKHSLQDLICFVEKAINSNNPRAVVVKMLQDAMGYTPNSAASAYSRATRALGITTGGSSARRNISEVVGFMRKNAALGRKESVNKMCEELGYAESTANTFYTYLPLAKEYARQEIADLSN